jgi:hypothetical protein
MGMKHWLMVMVAAVAGLGLCGCVSSSGGGHDGASGIADASGLVEIEGASYDEVFAAARQVLGEYRFGINRVDATRGVITSYAKRTEGLGSFWDREQSSLSQEWEDLANQQERTVRIEFGLDDDSEVVRARVRVYIERVHRPNWRVESESLRLSTFARSRDSYGAFEPSEFREPIGQDPLFADRLANEIHRRFE